ncbi:putative bifunctional diguanylate cyclase/phosphodiesterase [Roseateles sp.]|uniref:putative bifunctional diguanylate cyclase/phosphodiesterase n=1 Tax=Roseateles sp. TaxID=1971397 RepID=UPI003BA44785
MLPPEFAQSVLDAVSAQIAVVAHSGEIIAVNAAWAASALKNGPHPASGSGIGIGSNYLEVCRVALAHGATDAALALEGIQSVLSGKLTCFVHEYPCHFGIEQHWFSMRVTPMPMNQGVVVAHEDITARCLAEARLKRSHEQLEARVRERTQALEISHEQLRVAAMAFNNTVEAVVISDREHKIVRVNGAFLRLTGYGLEEVLGRSARLYSSDRQGEDFYRSRQSTLDETGSWQGEIWNIRKNGEIFPAWESLSASRNANGQITHYVSVFSDISTVKRAEERLVFLAHHDPLTGLANRLLFSARLEQSLERARRHGSTLALMFIDMDNFKLVNDSLGHEVGDHYLRTVGQRLQSHLRAEDTVARLGGDEFGVITEGFSDNADVIGLADELVSLLAQEMHIAGHEVASSASIGISLFPDDADSTDTLMKAADAAMYLAKAEGRNTVRFFHADLRARALQRLEMESRLRHAVERQELLLHYQPLVDLASGECMGMEALLRWNSPDYGLLYPDSFIPMAEESRQIIPIGIWVAEQALRDLTHWRTLGLDHLELAINVSWRQFNDSHFVDRLNEMLAAQGVRASQLKLNIEVTESTLQSSVQAVRELERARQAGVHVLIDDFGTGYSSLGQLMHMPVDGVKIDRLFLRDATQDQRSRAIIHSVLTLAQGLGLSVVAEGIETPEQAALLKDQGCRYGQGFLFGAAMPASEVPSAVLARAKAAGIGPTARSSV